MDPNIVVDPNKGRKILQIYDSVAKNIEELGMMSYKSIGVPFHKMNGSQRNDQKIVKLMADNGTDAVLWASHIFSRLQNRYIYFRYMMVDHYYSFIQTPVYLYVLGFEDTAIEMVCFKFSEILGDEADHKVVMKSKKDGTEVKFKLGELIAAIGPRIKYDETLFNMRMINKIIGRFLIPTEEAMYNIWQEIRDIFNNDVTHVARIKKFYTNVINSVPDILWITMPKYDTKIFTLFSMINYGLFGPDAEIIASKGGYYGHASVKNRKDIFAEFGIDMFGPIGVMIVQGNQEKKPVRRAIQFVPTMFIQSSIPDEDSEWEGIERIDVEFTLDYSVPRVKTFKKFNVQEIYDFLDELHGLTDDN